VVSLLSSNGSPDELQSHLTDLVGFDDLDFIIELLARKDEIVASVSSQKQQQQEPTGRRLLSKSEREDALRRQDQEHKSASLLPSQTREVQYPHVYKAYNAGNTLSHSGKKYGLPFGSERLQFEKYEEYFVPAGKKGVLGPGRKLVEISSLDGLCRKTFKGYTALNRMQSLVFPVAYKTNENMLICAPTGAVSRSAPHILANN
jgi:antiviral helicase SLH1